MTKITLPGSPGMKRPWLQTLSGEPFFPSAPEEYNYTISEIAIVISRESRFNGHTLWFYSVGAHSCHVALRVLALAIDKYGLEDPVIWKLAKAGLIHDGAEGYYKDLISPIKNQLHAYKVLIKQCEVAQFAHFGLREFHDHPLVKLADYEMLATEKRDVLGTSPYDSDWASLPPPLTKLQLTEEYPMRDIEGWFLMLWDQLERQELPSGLESYQ